jgi:hypothetical protein
VANLTTVQLLRSPAWHRFVRRVHRAVEEGKYGRDPTEPLRPGEATEDPGRASTGFLKYFIEEMKNQAKGKPTESPPGVQKYKQPKR